MPVNSTHPEYSSALAAWTRCRDTANGEDAVKSRGETYLPKPGGLDRDEYSAYSKRAVFYEAVGKTLDSFVGVISRKRHVIELPDRMQPLIDDATGNGIALDELIKHMAGEVLLMGRGGILVDFDETLQRAQLALYQTEAIVNWSKTGIVLYETVYEADPLDAFKQVAIEQYRQLEMVDGAYTVTVWRKAPGLSVGNEWVVYATATPTKRGGKTFDAIPFVWLSPIGSTSAVQKPPLLGLVSLCLSHFRVSADLYHGAYFTGMPTLYATGISDQDGPIRVGAMAVITLRDPQAKVGYAEFSGQGLQTLFRLIEDTERRMAAVGAGILGAEASKRNETLGAAEMRHAGEVSLLSGAVSATQAALKMALGIAAEWMGVSGKIEVTLNTDFVSKRMDGATLTGLVQALQAGGLSQSAFQQALCDGDIIPQSEADAA